MKKFFFHIPNIFSRMVRTKNVDKFHHYVTDLWSFLKKLFVDDVNTRQLLNKVKSKHRQMDQLVYLEYVLKNLQPYINYITRKDEFMFTPEFGNKPLNFLIGFDFRLVWKRRQLSSDEKRITFRYLEFLYLQASLALDKNQEKVKEIIQSIKTEQEIEREATENPNMFGDQDGEGGLAALFGEDNLLLDLANDMSNEFNLQEMLGGALQEVEQNGGQNQNPLQALQNISQNPQLQQMMAQMAQRVTQKMEERGITQDDLMKSAEGLKKNLGKNVEKMVPGGGAQIRRMMNQFDIEGMAEQFGQQTENNTTDDPDQMMQQMFKNLTTQMQPGNQVPGNQVPGNQIPDELQQLMAQFQQQQQQQQQPSKKK